MHKIEKISIDVTPGFPHFTKEKEPSPDETYYQVSFMLTGKNIEKLRRAIQKLINKEK